MRLQIDWTSLVVRSKFTVFALFYFVFEGNFPSTSPRGAYIWRGDLTEGFLRYRFGVTIFGGAYFRNFTVIRAPARWSGGRKFESCFSLSHARDMLIISFSHETT